MHRQLPEQRKFLRKKDIKLIDRRCFRADIVPKEIKLLTWHNDQGYLMIGTLNYPICWIPKLNVEKLVLLKNMFIQYTACSFRNICHLCYLDYLITM